MKFEKFLKMSAGRGVIVDREDGEKWLLFGGAMLRVPEGVNVIAALTMSDKPFINHVFNEYADDAIFNTELTGAKLPTPYAPASKVIRIFTDTDGGEFGVTNKGFALIEKGDSVYTVYDEAHNDEQPVAVVVLTGYGDNEEIAGIIFDDYYFAEKINERE